MFQSPCGEFNVGKQLKKKLRKEKKLNCFSPLAGNLMLERLSDVNQMNLIQLAVSVPLRGI